MAANRSEPSASEASEAEREGRWDESVTLLKAIAHPTRLAILEVLSEGSRCVKDLNALVALSQPNLSQHMAALRKARLVDNHARGTLRCYYLLRPTLVGRLIELLRQEHPARYRDRETVQREALDHQSS